MAFILLIDDDDDVRGVTAELLRHAGHVVDTAADGETGLERYEAGRHDLIITDIMMPKMEGLEMIRRLRYVAQRTRIIAISGGSRFSESTYLPAAQKLGVQRVLAKPIRSEVLLQAVAEVLAEPIPPTVPRPRRSDDASIQP